MLMLPKFVAAQTDFQCGKYAVWKEARGETLKVQRAVLDTIQNRARKTGKGLCYVLRKAHQFPYFKRGVKHVDKSWDVQYNAVLAAKPVLGEDYLFFNTIRLPWGTSTKRLGHLYFSE